MITIGVDAHKRVQLAGRRTRPGARAPARAEQRRRLAAAVGVGCGTRRALPLGYASAYMLG